MFLDFGCWFCRFSYLWLCLRGGCLGFILCVDVLVVLFWWAMVCCVWSWWFVNVGRCKAVLEFGCIGCGLCCIDSLVAFALVLIFDLRVGGWLVVAVFCGWFLWVGWWVCCFCGVLGCYDIDSS